MDPAVRVRRLDDSLNDFTRGEVNKVLAMHRLHLRERAWLPAYEEYTELLRSCAAVPLPPPSRAPKLLAVTADEELPPAEAFTAAQLAQLTTLVAAMSPALAHSRGAWHTPPAAPGRPTPPTKPPTWEDVLAHRAPRLSKLTVGEREWLHANGCCFQCRLPGHLRKDCPHVAAIAAHQAAQAPLNE